MTSDAVTFVQSKDNPQLKALRRLASEPTAYRAHGCVWLEGEHLCQAASARGISPKQAVFSQTRWTALGPDSHYHGTKCLVVADALWSAISALPSPAGCAFVVDTPPAPVIAPLLATVVLDRVQDAGNVGSILRSAAAFGFAQVIALSGTAALWSPKVLRAGMGAHFALRLIEGADLNALDALHVPLLVTSSHSGQPLHASHWPWPCAWAFGHEGQGLAQALMQRAQHSVRIAQPGGEESLNVAAAAAICLHASGLGSEALAGATQT